MIRILLISILFLLLSSDLYSNNSSSTIETLIQKVKQSRGDARREAMNALKQQLRSANKATRAKAIASLRQRLQPVHTTRQNHIVPHREISIPKQPLQQPLSPSVPVVPTHAPRPQRPTIPTKQPTYQRPYQRGAQPAQPTYHIPQQSQPQQVPHPRRSQPQRHAPFRGGPR